MAFCFNLDPLSYIMMVSSFFLNVNVTFLYQQDCLLAPCFCTVVLFTELRPLSFQSSVLHHHPRSTIIFQKLVELWKLCKKFEAYGWCFIFMHILRFILFVGNFLWSWTFSLIYMYEDVFGCNRKPISN